MSRPSEADIDAAILAYLRSERWRCGQVTYVIRNALQMDKVANLKTYQVCYRLAKMEAAGKVERVPSNYAVMICWRVTT